MGFKMDFAGFDELATELHSMATDELKEIEDKALKAGAEIVKANQIANWNRSGVEDEHIKDNVRIGRTFETEEGSKIAIAPIMKLRWRGKFVEYGTSRQPPQAPVEKSLSQSENEVANAMMKVMERVVEW